MAMTSKILVFSALSGIILALVMRTSSGDHGNLPLTARDYADGAKRQAAVLQKTTPTLKKALAQRDLAWQSPIFIRAFKEEKVLELWVAQGEKFVLFKSYPILAASGKLGPKLRQGDRQVPEGFYFVTPRQMNPQSRFHLSFNIGYPNAYDRAHDRTGDFIMIHGSDVSIGCLAMGDAAIEEIYTLAHAAFAGGQKFFRVHLFPFRMNQANMTRHAGKKWLPFWRNLQTGYRWFEEKKAPPNVTVAEKRYHFGAAD